MVKGIRHVLLCRGRRDKEKVKEHTDWLDLPEGQWTKEGSRDTANAWWDRHLSRILIEDIESHEEAKAIAGIVTDSAKHLGLSLDSSVTAELIDNSDRIGRASPKTKFLSHWQKEFLDSKKSDKQRGPGRFDNLKRSIDRFAAFIGGGARVEAVTESAYQKFYDQLMAGDFSDYFRRDTMRDVKTFIAFLWQQRALNEELRNLDTVKVKVVDPAVQHFTADELREILTNATGPVRLFVWLFANCGMRQKDVSSITHSMFDGKYLTRKRGKTQDHARAPRVSHLLWPETLKLIAEHRTVGKGSELMFLQPNGKPWVLDDDLNENDRRRRDDNFAELWHDFTKEHPQRLPAKYIRGSAANLITGNNQISLQVKFLGDVASGVILKHYVDPPQAELDKALTRLRKSILGNG